MIKRKFNYLSIKSFLLSIVIVIFTGFALSAYSQADQVIGLKPTIIIACSLLSILINLEEIIEHTKYSSLYYTICKTIALIWYVCFVMIVYKYFLLESYEV
jgi:hypothetical protein